MPLRPAVREALARLGLAAEDDSPAALREKLNELYLEDVRRLRARHVAGEIPRHEYALHVQALKERYGILGLPLQHWEE